MSLLSQIKKDQLVARKEKSTTKTKLLTTLIGDVEMIGKNDGNRETTDSETMAVIKKFIKNINEVLAVSSPGTINYNTAYNEKRILQDYLPKQLEEDELREIVSEHISQEGYSTPKDMGKVMKWLKESYDGQFDGKLASSIVKLCLNT